MGDDDHGDAGPGQLLHHVEHLADHLGVERRGRLVEQQHLRLHGERPGDADALLLAAGELAGIFVDLVLEPDARQQLARPLVRVGPGQAAHPHRRQRDVAQHGHVRKEVEALEHHADLGADRGAGRRLRRPSMPSTTMVPPSCSSSWLMQRISVDLPEPEGPMTQTISPSLDLEVDAVQSAVKWPKDFADRLHVDDRLAHQRPLRARRFSSTRDEAHEAAAGSAT